jgi:hypothetical protein
VKSVLRRRPSPALVISLVALFVSLSGVSYGVATGFIDSREIKNNEVRSLDIRNNEVRTRDIRNNEVRGIDIRNSTIQGRDIGLNQVTGEDVREDTLGKVPSAVTADTAASATTAASAGTAASVGGLSLSKIAYMTQAGGGFEPVLSFGGLTLEARCEAGPALALRANPVAGLSNSELAAGDGFAVNDSDFDPGDNTVIAVTADEPGVIVFAGSDGSVVVVNGFIRNQQDGVAGTDNDCGFFGTVEAG